MIDLNDCTFVMGQNLHSALQHLQYENRIRTLWIDLPCMDQENMFEHSRQVRVMSTIHSQASSVLAWLGGADEYSDRAIEIIEDMCWVVWYSLARYSLESLHLMLTIK